MTEQSTISLRDAFGQILMRLAEEEARLVVLDADLSQSTRTSAYRQKYPSRYLNVGIAEQNMVSVAAGIALAGGVPLVCTFAAFLTRRAADQIAISVAFPKLNVKFFGFHAGVNLGEDGATQQSVEDLAIMQAIPGIRVYSPCDARDLEWAVADAMAHHGPTYVRLARFPSPVRLGAEDSTGGFRFLRRATGPVVVTTGTLASEVLGAAEALATEGRELSVVGVRQVKPLAPDLVTALGPGPLSLAVAEEHNVHGGLADAGQRAARQPSRVPLPREDRHRRPLRGVGATRCPPRAPRPRRRGPRLAAAGVARLFGAASSRGPDGAGSCRHRLGDKPERASATARCGCPAQSIKRT